MGREVDDDGDGLPVGAIEPDHDIAGQQPGLRGGTIRLDLCQQRTHRVVDAGNDRVTPRDRRGLAGDTDIGAADITVADDFRQHELRALRRRGAMPAHELLIPRLRGLQDVVQLQQLSRDVVVERAVAHRALQPRADHLARTVHRRLPVALAKPRHVQRFIREHVERDRQLFQRFLQCPGRGSHFC